MGIQGLTKIIQNCPSESYRTYRRIIIDGSNLLYTKLTRHVSQLRKLAEIKEWKSPDADILFQLKYIIDNTVNEIERFIDSVRNKYVCEELYFVMDPKTTPKYIINGDMNYITLSDGIHCSKLRDTVYVTEFIDKNDVEDNVNIELNIKSEEQEIRRKRNSKVSVIECEIDKIDKLLADNPELADKVKSIYMQSFYFNSMSELGKLNKMILLSLESIYQDEPVYVISAVNEADLVIKNIALDNVELNIENRINMNWENDYVLVMSADTDYFVLFSDSKHVHVTTLTHNDPIYCPNRCWNCFLEDAFSYDAVIRVAPILGNDYTTHNGLISATNNSQDVRYLFNINGDFNKLKQSSRKKIYNIVIDYAKPVDENNQSVITKVDDIDKLLFDKDRKYFKKYFLSVVIYKNWANYNQCHVQRTNNLDHEIYAMLRWLLNKLNQRFPIIYKWDSADIFIDWNKFGESIEAIKYESIDAMLIEYHKLNVCTCNTDGDEFALEGTDEIV